MASARRELAERPGLSDTARHEARRAMRAEQQRELRRLVAAWWERRLSALHDCNGRSVPGIRAVERLERDAGLEEVGAYDIPVLRGLWNIEFEWSSAAGSGDAAFPDPVWRTIPVATCVWIP